MVPLSGITNRTFVYQPEQLLLSTSSRVFIVSAPSGAGKTSLIRALTQSSSRIVAAVSHTTRARRPGESDGKDYHFVTRNMFEEMIGQHAFLEFALVFDNLYGTSLESVNSQRANGNHVLLEIDWQGAGQIRKRIPDAVSIFIMPPSLKSLEIRLRERRQDSDEVIQRRMREARSEMAHYPEYDYVIVNENFVDALSKLTQIVNGHTDEYIEPENAVLEKILGE